MTSLGLHVTINSLQGEKIIKKLFANFEKSLHSHKEKYTFKHFPSSI
jgi:hypothetical protein